MGNPVYSLLLQFLCSNGYLDTKHSASVPDLDSACGRGGIERGKRIDLEMTVFIKVTMRTMFTKGKVTMSSDYENNVYHRRSDCENQRNYSFFGENNVYLLLSDYENKVYLKRSGYENRVYNRRSDYENNVDQRRIDYENNVFLRRSDYENNVYLRRSDYENKFYPKRSHFENNAYLRSIAYESNVYHLRCTYKNNVYLRSIAYENNVYHRRVNIRTMFTSGAATMSKTSFENSLSSNRT